MDDITKNAVLPSFLGRAAYPQVYTFACADPELFCP